MNIRQNILKFTCLSLFVVLMWPALSYGKKAVVIYITDYEGINSFVSTEIANLQKMGVEVFPIDFLEQHKGLGLSDRKFKWSQLDQVLVVTQIQKTVTAINLRKDLDLDVMRIGVVAESESGLHAIRLASENPNYRAVVLRNPTLVFDKAKFENMKAKLMLVISAKKYDATKLQTFEQQLKNSHVQFEIVAAQADDRFYDLSQPKRYIASDAENYKTKFYEFIKRFVTLEQATKY